MNKRSFFASKNLVKIITVATALFVAVALITSSSLSATLSKMSETKNLNLELKEEEPIEAESSTGLAPKNILKNPIFTTAFTNNYDMMSNAADNFEDVMYGYVASDPSGQLPEGPCYFPLDDPGDIISFGETSSSNFIAGGTWAPDEIWYGIEYGSGVLYGIDIYTGDMWSIGGGGTSCNGLAWDPIINQLYGASSNALYVYDPDTGEQEYIGPFNAGDIAMIGIASYRDGTLYGWDVKQDKLWTIDTESGQATLVGPLGIDINYAQDGHFDYDTCTLYLTAYTTLGQLYKCDKETGECTLIDNFPGGAQITGSMIKYCLMCPDHDVGVKNILSPKDEEAGEDMDVIVRVKNHGNNTEEDVPVNVVILKDGVDEEYNETEYIDQLIPGETVDVEMPVWTPDDWQIVSNEYIDYKITAYTSLCGDDYPNNDYKEKWFELYFGYFHDVGATNVSGPVNGPAQTFPVNGIIKNFGQYDECCFKTYLEITELDIDNPVELLNQDFSDSTFPPSGWTRTHSNWMYSNSDYAGGSPGEAKFHYSPSSAGFLRLYTPAIDTSDCDAVEIEFKHYVDHYVTPYTLQVETSADGVNWDVVWEITPTDNIGPETITILKYENVGTTTYVSWTFSGNSYNIDNWYVDDIEINGYPLLDPEYEDYKCTTSIDPGEEQLLEFDEWTPVFLAEETTGTKKYLVKAWTEMEEPEDENPDNDLFTKYIILDFFHDVGIKEVTNPAKNDRQVKEWLHFDNGENVGACSLMCACKYECAIRLTPDELAPWAGHYITVVKRHHSGGNISFWMEGLIKIYEEGSSSQPGDLITEESFECYEADWHDVELSDPVYITGYEDIWVSVKITKCFSVGNDPGPPVKGKGNWVYCGGWAEARIYGFYCNWNLWAGIEEGDLLPDVYIQPGTHDIDAVAENIGTFPELDLTCYAEIYEYITDPENGTLVYEDNITDIDLEEPLGGTELLNFDDYTFAMEGVYGLYLDLPLVIDDFPDNNQEEIIIGVDDAPPFSWHELDPPEPDGDNGWYVSDVEVTICAEDPEIAPGIPGSGVKEIRIRINGGAVQAYPVDCITIILHEDGQDIQIGYWAVDNVGNEESKKVFFIDMDQTVPDIGVVEWDSYKEGGTWYVKFTCEATDDMSGMDRLEMYIDDELHETNTGSGPSYEFVIEWSSEYKTSIFKFVAFDKAGNSDFDELDGSDIQSASRILSISHHSSNMWLLQLLERFPLLHQLLRVWG